MHYKRIDGIALGDFNVERATYLRENLMIDGIGQITERYFELKQRFLPSILSSKQ
ncbi:MAG: hypothetical protein V4535_01075 [Bacteroidota bacterium]